VRHLFVVHSNITHRVAECAIERQGLATDDVLMLGARNFDPGSSDYR